MTHAEPVRTNRSNAVADSLTQPPSVTSSLEHLVAGSQGVVTKRIDLALLEGRELLSRSVQGAALGSLGVILAAAAWMAAAASALLFAIPEAGAVIQLAVFAVLNAVGAAGLVAFAGRAAGPPTDTRQDRIRPDTTG